MGAALSSGPWLVCADAGGKNTHAVQILTATFTELKKPCSKPAGFTRLE